MAIPFLHPIGNINISDGTPQLKLTDTSSSATTTLTLDGVNLTLQNLGTDGDFTIIGKDGSSNINLLAFDTSEGGAATFAGDVALTGSGDKIISAISSDDDATLFLSGAGSGKDVHIVYGNDRDLFISKSSSSTATSEGTPVLTLGGNSNATFAGNVISKDTFYLENGSGNRWQMLFDTNAFNLRYYNGSSWSADAFAIDTSNNATFAGNILLDGTNQIHFVAQSGESNTEAMRITRSSDKMYFTYGTNAGDEAFYINSDGTVKFEENATFAGSVGISGADASSYNANGDNLVIAGSGNVGMTISSTNSSDSNVFFADGTSGADAYRGILRYTHDDNGFDFYTNATLALNLDSSQNATFEGNVTIEGSLALGEADTASGHINAKELMTFNIDTDNDDTNRYFGWYTNGADGSGTELLKILETGDATFAGSILVGDSTAEAGHGIEIQKDGGGASIGLLIHNQGTDAADDSKISFETQGQRDISIGIDRSDSFFKISHSGSLGTNDWQTFDGSGNVTFAGDIELADGHNTLTLTRNLGAGVAPGTSLGFIQFNNDASTSSDDRAAIIEGVTDGGSANATGGSFKFWTKKPADGVNAVALTLDSSQNATFEGDVNVKNASTRIISLNYEDSINSIISHSGTNFGLESLNVRGDNIYFYTDYDSGTPKGNLTLTLDSSHNATFAGDVSLGATDKGSNTTLSLYTNDTYKTTVKYQETSGYYGFSTEYDGNGNAFTIRRHSNSQAGVAVMTMNRDDANTTFEGNINGKGYLNLQNGYGSANGIYLYGNPAMYREDVNTLHFPLNVATFAGNVTASSGTGHFSNVNSSSYQLNGTYVMDSSRNLVNIAAITTTGAATFGGDGIINTANKALKVRYSTGSASYEGRLRWAGLQLGNNGTNRIVAGNTVAGGSLAIYTNNTNDGSDYNVTPDGAHAASFQADGDTILHQNVGIGTSSPGAKLNVYTGGNSIAAAAVLQHDTFGADRKVGLGFELGSTQIKAAVGFISDDSSPGTYGRGNLIFCVDSNDDNAPVGHADEKLRISHTGTATFTGTVNAAALTITAGAGKLAFANDAANYYAYQKDASDGIVVSGYYGVSLAHRGNMKLGVGSGGISVTGTQSVSGEATFNGKLKIYTDGTLNWGAAYDYGRLTHDTNVAIVAGLSGKALVLRSNGSGSSNTALTLDTSQNATFAGKVFSKHRKECTASISNSYVKIYQISTNSSQMASLVRITATTHGTGHVAAWTADVIVNHYQDVTIKSHGGEYTQGTIKVESNNNGEYHLSFKSTSANASTYYFTIESLSSEQDITVNPTSTPATNTVHEHVLNFGTNITGEGGTLKHNFGGTVDGTAIGGNSTALRGTSLTIDSRLTLHDGEIDNNSGDLTLDSAGDIILDAGGNEIKLKTGGSEWGQIYNSSSDLAIYSSVSDKDIIFKGNDGGSLITALTLDMSEGGNATFAGRVGVNGAPTNTFSIKDGSNANFEMGCNSDSVFLQSYNRTSSAWAGIQFNTNGETMRLTADGRLGIGIATPQTHLQVNGTHSNFNAHIGQGQDNGDGRWGGISLGYAENGNANYRKVGIVAEAHGDGAARQDFHILVDTANDGNSAVLGDSKFKIDGLTGNTTFAGNVGIAGSADSVYSLAVNSTDEDAVQIYNSTDGLDALITFQNPGGTLGRIQGLDNGGLGFDTGNNAGGINSNVLHLGNGGNATFSGRVVTGNTTIGNWSNSDRIETSGDELTLGTHSNHDVIINRQASAALTFSSGAATFAGEITSGDDMNTPTKLVVGESATAEVRIKKTDAGYGKVSWYNNNGSSAQAAYISLASDEHLYYYLPSSKSHIFYGSGSERFKIGGDVEVTGSTDFAIPTGRRIKFDGAGGHTYIMEEGDNNMKFYVGGTEHMAVGGGDVWIQQPMRITQYIYHTGDLSTQINMETSQITIATSGGSHIQINNDENIYFRTNGTNRFRMDTQGTFTATQDIIAYGSVSDKSYKENIKPITGALDLVGNLKGVTFDWKEDTDTNKMVGIKEDIGFIAQDVQEVLPTLVRENEDGKLSLRDKGIVPVLVEAIKELKAEVEELKKHKCDGCTK